MKSAKGPTLLVSKMVQVDLRLRRMSQMLVDIQLHSKRPSCLLNVNLELPLCFEYLPQYPCSEQHGPPLGKLGSQVYPMVPPQVLSGVSVRL